ncbi:MAG: ATP-binding protein, partial [Xanthomonadales bacterium]|nr:ATP-binding protein [Xanthomonadales bacterium]
VCAVSGALQDVSASIEAQQQAQSLLHRLAETLENVNDGFFILDRDWNFVFLNSHAERLLERKRDEVIGCNIWKELPVAAGSAFQRLRESGMDARAVIQFTEWHPPLKRWFKVNARPTVEGLAVYFSDASERKELEERLSQTQRLEAIGQLTGGVAHDFNNLLTVILGNAELLSSELADDRKLRPFADMIATAADSGAALTSRLLAFARRQPLQPQLTNVNQLVAGMEELLRRTLGENIEMEVVHAGGLWVTEIDPAQLENALLNLAINARDAMPDGGRLTIETANASLDDEYAAAHEEVSPGQYVLISVSDDGIGMSHETREKAFDPFFTTKSSGRGSGLGLSMIYGFVKQSGGHAKIYSEIGEGTTVRLYFPRSHHTAAITGPTAEMPEQVLGHQHILVVEDDDAVRQNLIRQLTSLGYHVSATADGPSALEALGDHKDIALLFTDVVLPGGMNGRELADAATATNPKLKILFTSGYSENAIVHHGRLMPGTHLLSKPYRLRELAIKVNKVLNS